RPARPARKQIPALTSAVCGVWAVTEQKTDIRKSERLLPSWVSWQGATYFDLWPCGNNATDIQSDVHSVDGHGINHVKARARSSSKSECTISGVARFSGLLIWAAPPKTMNFPTAEALFERLPLRATGQPLPSNCTFLEADLSQASLEQS